MASKTDFESCDKGARRVGTAVRLLAAETENWTPREQELLLRLVARMAADRLYVSGVAVGAQGWH